MNNPFSIKPKSLKVFAISSLALTLLLTGCSASSSSSDSNSTPPVAEPMGGYCVTIMSYLQQSVNVMAGAGTTSTPGDILSTLKENGDKLSKGFDSSMVDTQSNADLLYQAGNALLRIRVDVENGNATSADSSEFLAKFKKIKAICGTN